MKFSEASFSLSIIFQSSGFTKLTENISKFLKKQAEHINNSVQDAGQKIKHAISTVQELKIQVGNIKRKRNEKINYLNELSRIKYKWFEVYKYLILGIRIAVVSIEIAALEVAYISALNVLKTAEIALEAARELLKIASSSAQLVLEGVGNLISIIGKSIDWLIKIQKVWSSIDLNAAKSSGRIEVGIDFILCGKGYQDSVAL